MTDRVRVSTIVPLDPDAAFRVFVEDMDRWWRRSPRHLELPAPETIVRLEPGVGGRLLETTGEGTTVIAEITDWDPGRHIAMEWLGHHLVDSEHTRVEIRFEPHQRGSRVTVEHAGWAELEPGGAQASVIGLWWAELLAAYIPRASYAAGPPERRTP